MTTAGTMVFYIVQLPAVRIAIGADHAGFLLKEHLKATLTRLGHTVDDLGTHSEESVDYPPICFAVGRAVVDGRAERGIVLGAAPSWVGGPTRASCGGGGDGATRSPPTRSAAFAPRSATISTPHGCRA